ncbi:penicillin-binding transpeptidase domain-containing protein, partial [Anaerosporobacter sp.]|uniref:penicillin-binding transpeptidase domain-containing protein n=1 Tax=Anaerosporobacter sp. TaxID=1872529 RepID=UPI00286F296D
MKKYITMSILLVLVMCILSACSSKESNGVDKNIKEQTEELLTNNEIYGRIQDEKSTQEIKTEAKRQENEHIEPEDITVDYTEEFQSMEGCAVIFDESKNAYMFYNEEACKTEVSPCSTFKIASTLIGLHNQVITSEESKMGYNGMEYPVDSWNADLNLRDAFQNSCVWYFRKIIDEVGKEEVKEELLALNYGNCDVSEWNGSGVNAFPQLNGFWLNSSLEISPWVQVGMLRNIIDGNIIYTQEEVNILKDIMFVETKDVGKIYGKTGTGSNHDAWFVGFVEKEESYIYFAVYLKDDDSDEVNGTMA